VDATLRKCREASLKERPGWSHTSQSRGERCRFEAECRMGEGVNTICRTSGAHASTTENPGLAARAYILPPLRGSDWMRFAQYLGQLCLVRRGGRAPQQNAPFRIGASRGGRSQATFRCERPPRLRCKVGFAEIFLDTAATPPYEEGNAPSATVHDIFVTTWHSRTV